MKRSNSNYSFSHLWFPAIAIILATILAVFVLSGCKMNAGNEALAKRVNEYYILEQQNKWGLAYEVRTPEFRRAVSQSEYVRTMLKDNKGWMLKDVKILSSSRKGDKAYLKMKFVELVPPEYFDRIGLQHKSREVTFEEMSVWKNVAGQWYCVEPGERSHLPMNSDIVGY